MGETEVLHVADEVLFANGVTEADSLFPVSERACATEAVWIPQTMLLADDQAMHDIAAAVRKVQTHAKELL